MCVSSQLRQLEKAGASPGFHKVEFIELLSSTSSGTKICRITQQQPNKCHQLIESKSSTVRNFHRYFLGLGGEGDVQALTSRAACAMHHARDW